MSRKKVKDARSHKGHGHLQYNAIDNRFGQWIPPFISFQTGPGTAAKNTSSGKYDIIL